MQLLAIVTLHDACPAFSSRTYEITEQLEKLEVRYNIGLVPFFNGEQDLPRFPKFVKQIECCSAEIALHGLYHENKRHQIDDFSTEDESLCRARDTGRTPNIPTGRTLPDYIYSSVLEIKH